MIQILLQKAFRKKLAFLLALILGFELMAPVISMALTSGPVQPEVNGFEPVGTTDMVDPFTGDFVYNIPLMDVEGYPINISYHGGVDMEQEASWVGLGWSLNPGAVNRIIRGLPDDFAGDSIDKDMYIREEVTTRVGLLVGAELFSVGRPWLSLMASLGGYVNFSNYRGVSVDFSTTVGANAHWGAWANAGLNIGASVGSQTGGSINYDKHWGVGASGTLNHEASGSASFNYNMGGNYSPRTGRNSYKGYQVKLAGNERRAGIGASFSTGATIPINAYNTTQFNSNQAYMNSQSGQLKVGFEIFGVYAHPEIMGAVNHSGYDRNGSRKGFGYFNLDKADGAGNDVLDYSREKDGLYNATMGLLPLTHLTYDVYNVCGQGTGGSFRPVRNDIGAVYDPHVSYSMGPAIDGGGEGGGGNTCEFGFELKHTVHHNESGPWFDFKRKFTGPASSGFYEDVYFKEAGELTANNETYINSVGADTSVIRPEDLGGVPAVKPNSDTRVTRANYIYSLRGGGDDTAALLDGKKITSYDDSNGLRNYPNVTKSQINRVETTQTNALGRKPHHVSEIVQVQKDGRRYVYGLPTLNNVQREVTFAINDGNANKANYTASYQVGKDDSINNGNGVDNFYSSSVTPSYVSSYLLTSVLSSDYSDVTGDGITDDDLGTYTKFNYSRKSKDYRWRVPADSGKAQYIPGYITDKKDDKASYLIGSREQWMLHSIETKNYVAEFYVSPRLDAKGICEKILSPSGQVYHDSLYQANGVAGSQLSYKLDSIVLYNKQDRFINGANAKAIKAVLFTYDYSLCKGVPNGASGSGKLTLKSIQIKYGQSNINLSAAYKFGYDSAYNYNYNSACKDRWGMYKPNNAAFNNYEFPFTGQRSATDDYAKAWSLSKIQLPSGGIINVDYESDDYAYVQDKPAREMFMVAGFGDGRDFNDGFELYRSAKRPHLYLYFNRRKTSENSSLSFKDNYFSDSTLLYYNVPVSLTDGKYEPIKGYAQVKTIGACSDSVHGYIEMEEQTIDDPFECHVNPITYTALNVGRYNLPHIMFRGCDPDGSDIQNVAGGLAEAAKDVLRTGINPIHSYMMDNKGKYADLSKSFIRIESPGMKKKGGGQRVHAIKFYDNWSAMARGNEAAYGKEYDYMTQREDGKGMISSGVASWEPASGGDELPQRLPDPQPATLQNGTKFPPNAPVELYQELPIGESFYPAPVVGYRKVTARSIHRNEGRSSQSEDVYYFYTAKDFPITTNKTPLDKDHQHQHKAFSLQEALWENTATQGFSIVLNDMHGKPLNTEHWVVKPDSSTKARELISYQKNDYLLQNGQLSNNVPVFAYNAGQGKIAVGNKKMGIETDLTVDSREKSEETKTNDFSFSFNEFQIGPYPIPIAFGYTWPYTTTVKTKLATVTKITQQYGILSQVTNYNQGAITKLRNEVFDDQTGNVLVTSVNNEFQDKQYSVNYPANWAYKELGSAYENFNRRGTFDTFFLDTFGHYKSRFLNYNGGYIYPFTLPGKMPVGLAAVDQDLGTYRLGDEILLSLSSSSQPVRTWVMGYTSDTSHCYIVLATRQPFESDGAWVLGHTYNHVGFRIVRSGNRNRLGETIQSYTTGNASNIFPYLKDTLTDLISLSAQGDNHNLNQVYAANVSSDSLNPFVTGKVGTFRDQVEVVNLTNRKYAGGTTRKAGLYNSASYWKTERDEFSSYCDGVKSTSTIYDTVHCALDSFKVLPSFTSLGYDSLGLYFVPKFAGSCDSQIITIESYDSPTHAFHRLAFSSTQTPILLHFGWAGIGDHALYGIHYTNGCCSEQFYIDYNLSSFTPIAINRPTNYGHIDAWGTWYDAGGITAGGRGSSSTITTALPFYVRRKILLAKVGRYASQDNENWVNTHEITKYNWYGAELENKEEGIGYNAAVYGYNQQLPICVAKNARHSEVLFDGLEDYDQLQPKASIQDRYTKLIYSPIAAYMDTVTSLGTYKRSTLTSNSVGLSISKATAHTGYYSLKTSSAVSIPLLGKDTGMTPGYSFQMNPERMYVASLWARTNESVVTNGLNLGYSFGGSVTLDTTFGSASSVLKTCSFTAKSNVIEGWQQFEVVFSVPAGYKNFKLNLPNYFYVDDIRIYPFESNIKGFVYQPVTRKLMASLDENNYATFYEYDQEGNLVRTKKETEQGILTVSESRSTHQKNN